MAAANHVAFLQDCYSSCDSWEPQQPRQQGTWDPTLSQFQDTLTWDPDMGMFR